MALNLGAQGIIGQRGRRNILRQDIFRFLDSNLQMITASGVPPGQFEEGSMFFNNSNLILYISTNFKKFNIPTFAWYKFDGGTKDNTTNKRDLTTAGSPAFVGGKFGKAITLDGTDDKIIMDATTANLFDMDTPATFAMGFWIKLPATFANGEEVYILDRYKDATHFITISIKGNATPQGEVHIRADGTTNPAVDETYTNFPIPLNTWTYIWLKKQANDIRVYVNGDLQTENITSGYTFTTELLNFGYSTLDTSFGDNSYIIDDLKLWVPGKDQGVLDDTDLGKNHWAASELFTFQEAT